ncbi:MAG: hypothetical protein DRO40_13035 [Thermoprotei archaeon]|nr:MAG: hypothetical protein DRO40_13035 [Thermoprotei archaeon]
MLTRYAIRALALVLLIATIVLYAYPISASQYIDGVLIEVGYRDPYSTVTEQTLIDIIVNTYHRINVPDTFKLMYVRIYILNINGTDIVYSKYMGHDDFIDKSICYYTKIVIENSKVVNTSVEEMILGVDIDDPIVLNAEFTTQRSTETRWTVEAIVKSIIMLGINTTDFDWFSIAFAEIINPQDKLLSVIYVLDNHVYGVIYDWENHKVIRTGLDLISPPVNIPSLQRSKPTTPIPIPTPTLPPTPVVAHVESASTTITKAVPLTTTPSTTSATLAQHEYRTTTTKPTLTHTTLSVRASTKIPTSSTITIAESTMISTKELGTVYTITGTMEAVSHGKLVLTAIVALSAITVALITFIILRRMFM